MGVGFSLVFLLSGQAYAQTYTNGNPKWIGGNGRIYAIGAKVGINTNNPARGLHLKGAGHRYLRTTSTGGNDYSNFAAGVELQRTLDNGQSSTWDIVNQGTLRIRNNSWTTFQLDLNEAQLGVQAQKTTLNIWGNRIRNNGGQLDDGGLALRSYVSGQYQTLRLDGNQLESDTEMHLNFISDQDVAMVYGGGVVRIDTDEDEAKLNVASEGFQLKLLNGSDAWKVGVSNEDWASGAEKLIFTRSNSTDATLVMAADGNVGIGTPTPSATLEVDGTVRTTALEVNGTTSTNVLEITGGADLAEPFMVTDRITIQPGTVVAIDPAHAGRLKVAARAYDKTVAGIVSGAGNIQAGMVMGQAGTLAHGEHPVALTGRVYCRVDTRYGVIQPGDLLTTSDTPGHAMKVSNQGQAQGAIIGKAMTGLDEGTGLVLVLVSLQ